ncbi:hypothetical protein H6G33_09230 [Calothrix sp. FACHB-1219]|uniref:hypothetical protein n=1 Tax=unclassified Calothrix TaxID=2619626 RepID=UPI001689B2FD|nr:MULTISPECIES: hypothetical protein [unclassified Calothrix]MBD2201527.1 hypothetical protein [Calothrix sp. FACHB-168]MBD2217213.1 hypothetical protein [Calothrix sp. FACHB-1219]
MSADIDNWLLDTLIYYRQMDFFTQYQNLSNSELLIEIKKVIKRFYSNNYLYFLKERDDWYIIRLDNQRVLNIDFDVIYGNDLGIIDINGSIGNLLDISKSSRGFFAPEQVISYYINEYNEKIYTTKDLLRYFDSLHPDDNIHRCYKNIVEFEINGSKYSVVGDYDPSLMASQINQLIIKTGYQFYLGGFGDPTPMLLLNQVEEQKLQQERSLRFSLIKPRVSLVRFNQ